MSKDKGIKNVKKAAVTGGSKPVSDYQAGKKTPSNENLAINKKKKD
ncbi:hypothetical protein [Mucilaginibacter kameinonensis]|nr:hypothetical protein [Mucilaginibacter kameinonensis]